MEEDDLWIYLDGPEPEHLRPLLDALRDLPAATPESRARHARAVFATLAARPRAAPEPSEEETPIEEPPAEPAPSVSARSRFAGTAPVELSAEQRAQAGKLPFKSPEEAAPGKVAKTVQVPVMRSGMGETLPVGDDSIARAIAALPFLGTTMGTGVVPYPRLTLDQYASLRAELAAGREPMEQVLLKYHVIGLPSLEVLDDLWQKVFAAQPEVRAAFERALGEFTAWLRTVAR